MDAVYRLGEAGAAEVAEAVPLETSEASVRVTLGILEKKGHVRHYRDGQRHIYSATVPRERARRSALRHVLDTFFADSSSKAVLTMLDLSSETLTPEELDQIAAWLEQERPGQRDERSASAGRDDGREDQERER